MDPLISALLSKFVEKQSAKILDVVAIKTGESIGAIKDSVKKNFSAYLETTWDRCSMVATVFDRSKPVSLESIYTTTYLMHAGLRLRDDSVREIIINLPPGDRVRMFLIVGSGGTGKTFLMKWLFTRFVENEQGVLPLFIELRLMERGEEKDFIGFIYKTIVGRRAKISIDLFRKGIEDGDYILLLDGLDEIPYIERGMVIRQISSIQERSRHLIMVVSSRYDNLLNGLTFSRRYTIAPLNKRSVVNLVNKLPYDKAMKKKFTKDLNSGLYEKHTSFLSNPLLVCIMLITYADTAGVPDKMHIFYEQAFEVLFYKHDIWKDANFSRQRYCDLAIDEFRRCLASFCMFSYIQSIYEMSHSSALELIKQASVMSGLEVTPADFLNDCLEVVCILQNDGLSIKFSHRSFQEYFTAVFLVNSELPNLPAIYDGLAERRGDMVLRMSYDMNTRAFEKNWIIPRLQSFLDSATKSLDILKLLYKQFLFAPVEAGKRALFFDEKKLTLYFNVISLADQLFPGKLNLIHSLHIASRNDLGLLKLLWREQFARHAATREESTTTRKNIALSRQRWPELEQAIPSILTQFRSLPSDLAPSQKISNQTKIIDDEFDRRYARPRQLFDSDLAWFEQMSTFDETILLRSHVEELIKEMRDRIENAHIIGSFLEKLIPKNISAAEEPSSNLDPH